MAPASYVNRSIDFGTLQPVADVNGVNVTIPKNTSAGMKGKKSIRKQPTRHSIEPVTKEMMPRFSTKMQMQASETVVATTDKPGSGDFRAKYYQERMISEQLAKKIQE